MVRDPRGGHNRYPIDESFFKMWSSNMAYILGYIYADGCLIDARTSSRTQYLAIASKDASILHKINQSLGCTKPLYKRPPQFIKYPSGKIHKNSSIYMLRIGNKIIFNDLLKFGLTPRKSLSLKLPVIPDQYFAHFLRGYFDGDGCLMLSKPPNRRAYRVRLIFTTGSKQFLNHLAQSISTFTEIQNWSIYQQRTSFYLTYCKTASLEILKFMYSAAKENNLFLDRKYERYLYLLEAEENRKKAI